MVSSADDVPRAQLPLLQVSHRQFPIPPVCVMVPSIAQGSPGGTQDATTAAGGGLPLHADLQWACLAPLEPDERCDRSIGPCWGSSANASPARLHRRPPLSRPPGLRCRCAVAPTCRLWEALIRSRQTHLEL